MIEFKPRSKKLFFLVALEFFSNVISKKSIHILSDFISKDYNKSLSVASKKHDITGIRIFDKFEEEIPNLGFIPMLDQETNETRFIDTSSKFVRDSFKIKSIERKGILKLFSKKTDLE